MSKKNIEIQHKVYVVVCVNVPCVCVCVHVRVKRLLKRKIASGDTDDRNGEFICWNVL